MKSLRQHANDFFSTSISNVTKKMSFLLREHVDLSKMVVHENIQYGDHISHVCDIWHLKKDHFHNRPFCTFMAEDFDV